MQTRRGFLASLLATGAAVPLLRSRARAQNPGGSLPAVARPTPQQRAWQDLEIGMFIHFAPNTWQDREYDDRSFPLTAMRPEINTDQWADCAAALGAKYIVFVAKHAGGFCMWQTETTAYSIRNTPWRGGRGDVMADLAASCQRRGLKLGVYLSPRDDHFGAEGGGKCATPEKQAAYNALYRQQLTELLTRYGRMVEIWFDGSIVVPVGDILERHAPQAMIFQGPHATIRWVGNEDGFAPYPAWNSLDAADARTGIATAAHGDPAGETWLPNEVDVSLRRPNWFWSTTNEKNIVPLEALLEIYYRSVGHGAQLLLNVPPDRRGLIPEADFARAKEFGDEIRRRFGKSVAEISGAGELLALALPDTTVVDHILLQEDIAFGERVREYHVEGHANGAWQPLGGGSAIGHKRIQAFAPQNFEALRLVVDRSAAPPKIRRFAAFHSGAAAPATWNASAPVWADDEAGRWREGAFEADLTKRITAPGEYRARFVADGGGAVRVEGAELVIGGVAQPGRLRADPARPDVLLLRIAEPGRAIVLQGHARGGGAGTILVRKL
jgi:alpha-L-fucosidase